MAEDNKFGIECQQFDALLSEALDGTLGAAEMQRFQAHRESCPSCGPMFAEVERGRMLLRGLAEVEPPANFMHNVLAATIGKVEEIAPASRAGEPWWQTLRARIAGPVLHPKFAMSFAMAFFSISLVLSLLGVKLDTLKRIDLSPKAVVRAAYDAQARVVKYYENIRFVYEIETRVQELKRATTPEESNPSNPPAEKNDNKKKDNKDTSESRDLGPVTMAQLFCPARVSDVARETACATEIWGVQ